MVAIKLSKVKRITCCPVVFLYCTVRTCVLTDSEHLPQHHSIRPSGKHRYVDFTLVNLIHRYPDTYLFLLFVMPRWTFLLFYQHWWLKCYPYILKLTRVFVHKDWREELHMTLNSIVWKWTYMILNHSEADFRFPGRFQTSGLSWNCSDLSTRSNKCTDTRFIKD